MYCFHLFGWFSQQSNKTFIFTLCPDFHLHGDHLQFRFFFFFPRISVKANRHTGPQQLSERFLTSHLYTDHSTKPPSNQQREAPPTNNCTLEPAARNIKTSQPHPPTAEAGNQKSPRTQREKRTETEEHNQKDVLPSVMGRLLQTSPAKTQTHTR